MFKPNQVIFEKDSLEYPLGKELLEKFTNQGTKVEVLTSNRIAAIKIEDKKEKYEHEKKTLIVGVRKITEFQNCKPSAHYQLPLVSGCMGMCEYCYLNTRLGARNDIRIYVNTKQILDKAKQYIEQRTPEITIFEGAATSDPLPVEGYTHNLAKAIEFFGKEEFGRFRFVSKYPYVDSFLELEHNGHTEIRFSLNTQTVIEQYEHRTASSSLRIQALGKVAKAGYPCGVIIAPVFLYDNWKEEYTHLLKELEKQLKEQMVEISPSFEVITHRYTSTAKNRILEFYPETSLPMEEEKRQFKYGQFGYGKYLYKKEDMEEVKHFFENTIHDLFPNSKVLYII